MMVMVNMKNVIYCDITRCDNCGECISACEREHYGRVSMFIQPVADYFIPANCRHCEQSPCVEVCPTGACSRINDDVVTIAPMKCVGCQLCNLACPFGSIWFDTLDKISRKCDLCKDRLAYGLEPACIKACTPQHALVYGEFEAMVQTGKQRGLRTVATRSSGGSGMVVSLPADLNGKGG